MPQKCAKSYKAGKAFRGICVVIPETVVAFPPHYTEVEG